ncbi:TSUP family transporter [Anseongella ginsenosidimutans]|nr:TSUP family transporter [Anseongella ginsenosidimutans]
MRKWSSKHFRATLQAYFLPASILGVAGYAVKGLMTAEVFTYFLVSLPAAIPALFLGRYLNHKLNSDSFFRYVYFGLALIAGYLVYTAFA